MEVVRLADKSNFRQVEKEWQYEFMAFVLSSLKIPEEELAKCLPEDLKDFDISKKIEFRRLLRKYFITIVDDRDGGIKFYLEVKENENKEYVLVAEWKKCRFNFCEDPKAVDPSQKMYIEIVGNVWAIFDELEE